MQSGTDAMATTSFASRLEDYWQAARFRATFTFCSEAWLRHPLEIFVCLQPSESAAVCHNKRALGATCIGQKRKKGDVTSQSLRFICIQQVLQGFLAKLAENQKPM
jgi:hypothetical protein